MAASAVMMWTSIVGEALAGNWKWETGNWKLEINMT
jgi:hypothetical protein